MSSILQITEGVTIFWISKWNNLSPYRIFGANKPSPLLNISNPQRVCVNCKPQLLASSRPHLALGLVLSLVSSLYLSIAFCLSVIQLTHQHDHRLSFISQENTKINLTNLVVTKGLLKPLEENGEELRYKIGNNSKYSLFRSWVSPYLWSLLSLPRVISTIFFALFPERTENHLKLDHTPPHRN